MFNASVTLPPEIRQGYKRIPCTHPCVYVIYERLEISVILRCDEDDHTANVRFLVNHVPCMFEKHKSPHGITEYYRNGLILDRQQFEFLLGKGVGYLDTININIDNDGVRQISQYTENSDSLENVVTTPTYIETATYNRLKELGELILREVDFMSKYVRHDEERRLGNYGETYITDLTVVRRLYYTFVRQTGAILDGNNVNVNDHSYSIADKQTTLLEKSKNFSEMSLPFTWFLRSSGYDVMERTLIEAMKDITDDQFLENIIKGDFIIGPVCLWFTLNARPRCYEINVVHVNQGVRPTTSIDQWYTSCYDKN